MMLGGRRLQRRTSGRVPNAYYMRWLASRAQSLLSSREYLFLSFESDPRSIGYEAVVYTTELWNAVSNIQKKVQTPFSWSNLASGCDTAPGT
jgi:hypothetical protein